MILLCFLANVFHRMLLHTIYPALRIMGIPYDRQSVYDTRVRVALETHGEVRGCYRVPVIIALT